MEDQLGPFSGQHHTEDTKEYLSEINGEFYRITHPDDHQEIRQSLRQVCAEYGLTRKLMIDVLQGKQYHHKGFRCEKLCVYSIYKITNINNDKAYIGYTENVGGRLR